MSSLNLRILNAVLDAGYYIESREVAKQVHIAPATVRRYLVKLYREGLINRHAGAREGRAYVYFPICAEDVAQELGEEEFVALPGDEDVDAAIERTRPRWRIGELFPREAKQSRYVYNTAWRI